MSTRTGLIETAAKLLVGITPADDWPEYVTERYRSRWRRQAVAVLDAVLPQITTVEQLEALPASAKALDTNGDVWERYLPRGGKGLAWRTTKASGAYNCSSGAIARYGPLTVVWQPHPEQERPA